LTEGKQAPRKFQARSLDNSSSEPPKLTQSQAFQSQPPDVRGRSLNATPVATAAQNTMAMLQQNQKLQKRRAGSNPNSSLLVYQQSAQVG